MKFVNKKDMTMRIKPVTIFTVLFLCIMMLSSCSGKDTYTLAKKIHEYDLNQTGYEETLQMALDGNYDANCKDCFKGIDSINISLFSYACKVDIDIAKAVYQNGASIEVSNPDFPQSPLLAALDGNRNNPEIIYWLIHEGANINAIDYDCCSVFHYLRYWDDNEETQALIEFFKENCDLKYLKEKTTDHPYCSYDALWDENENLIFYAE